MPATIRSRSGDARTDSPGRSRACVARASVAALLFLIGCCGCATIGHPFPAGKVQEIRIGETTKSDLLATFGLPYRRGIEDGDSTWTYLHYRLKLIGEHARTRDLYVRFDRDGQVKSYTYSSNMQD